MTPRGRSHRVAALLLIVLPLLGCGASPQKKAELAERTVRSWAETLRLTRDELVSGAVPRVYAHQVLQAANQAREQQSKQPAWKTLPPDARSELDRALRQLESAVESRGRS
jgi:ABC-type sugar transport system substrate-binding protein